MKISADILDNQQIESFDILLNLLCEADYSETDVILKLEKQAYDLMRRKGENVNGLVAIALIQIMLDKRSKALAVANNIWDIGGEFNDLAELLYIDILMNLGLVDMASMLLRDKFENIEENIGKYINPMLKFSIITGNINLINRILNILPAKNPLKVLSEFTEVYRRNNYSEHFKNIQRIVFETIKDTVCSYEYALYTDRGFTDLEIFIYAGREAGDIDEYYEKIESRISSYLQAKAVKRIYNLTFTIRKIAAHPALV